MVGTITQGKTYSGIKLKICGTMFLYSKERQILMVSSRLQKVKPVHKKDEMSLPLIKEVINKLKDMKYFNKLDLIQEYNNMQIKEGDKWKVVFLTNKELFKTKSDVFWTMQLTRSISMDDEQYIQRTLI